MKDMNHVWNLSYVQVKKIGTLFGIYMGSILLLIMIPAILSSSFLSKQVDSGYMKDIITKIPSNKVYEMVASENVHFQRESGSKSTDYLSASMFFKLATNIAFNDVRSLLGNELPGFANFDSKILVAGAGTDYTNMPIESNVDLDQVDGNKGNPNPGPNPVDKAPVAQPSGLKTDGDMVHIYFSHNREAYASDPSNSLFTVIDVGSSIANGLISRGIGTSVDKTDVGAILISKKANYASSYDESRVLVQEAMAKNKKLTYLIDVHRDSQKKGITTIERDGLNYAKIAFIIGGDNPNYEQNLQLANALHQKFNTLFPGLSRGVFQKSGKGTNGKYNQDLSGKSMLIEMGGVDNTADELNRTAEVFAEAFGQYFWDAEAVSGQVSQ